ncbi:MAG: TonB family protein [Saprospiraceae bacterium]
MKKVDISRLERNRSINLRIGFAAALSMAILAFGWTSQRSAAPAFQDDLFLQEAEVKVVRTAQKSPAAKPPPSMFKITDKIVELPEVVFDANPVPAIVDTTFYDEIDVEPVPALAKPTPIFSPPKEEAGKMPDYFKIVEEMPRFPGCKEEGLSKEEKQACATEQLLSYLGNEIIYPAIARNNGIEGTVVIRFIIEKDGSISQPEIVREIGGGCGAEALRVVKSMPQWLPGKQQGRPVRVQFNLPVKYRLH